MDGDLVTPEYETVCLLNEAGTSADWSYVPTCQRKIINKDPSHHHMKKIILFIIFHPLVPLLISVFNTFSLIMLFHACSLFYCVLVEVCVDVCFLNKQTYVCIRYNILLFMDCCVCVRCLLNVFVF